MSDLISRQAATKCLEMFLDKQCDIERTKTRGFSDNDIWASVKMAYDALTAKKVGKWIHVSERLPEEKQDVLLAFRHNMVVGFWEDILNDGSQTWYANSGNAWFTGTESVDDDGIPIAWMPLPKPWKGETDDTD